MDHLKLTVDKLGVEEISNLVIDDSCGAVSLFIGTTRDNFEGKQVTKLEYEAYEPMALKALKSICEEIRGKWASVHGIAIYHRLGVVPAREASVVIAISSPHRQESLAAVAHCIESLKASVAIWKKEVYADDQAVWKENKECETRESKPKLARVKTEPPSDGSRELSIDKEGAIDKSLIQINVSNEELQKRIQNFIERKREQVNISNIHDFIPGRAADEGADAATCARVRTVFVKRKDCKGHLKIHKVHNEWGPQIGRHLPRPTDNARPAIDNSLPVGIASRVHAVEEFLNCAPVERDVYRRLKEMEDKMAELQALSPEYSQFWRRGRDVYQDDIKNEPTIDYTFTADDINKKIEQLEREGNV